MKIKFKTRHVLLTAAFALSGAALAADQAQQGGTRVEVNFQQPEQFTDLKRSFGAADTADRAYLNELRQYLQRTAENRLPAGQRLEVTITDVDMAGDFEPHRGPQFQDVRIVKEIYPPRINLSFRLLDAGGNVIAEGERNLKDTAFMVTTSPLPTNEPLRYEKKLLDDFVRDVAQNTRR